MDITFVRRRKLGLGSTKGMSQVLTGIGLNATQTLYERLRSPLQGLVVRWGCTASVPQGSALILNTAIAIEQVNNKRAFRMHVQREGTHLVPKSIADNSTTLCMEAATYPLVLRPSKHAQGRNLWVINSLEELLNVVRTHPRVFRDGWYAGELINKSAEYRVYVVQGKVATVAEKTPGDPDAVAWNVHQGGRFDVVRWGDWNMDVIKCAIESFNLSELDFGGVDVMVDQEGRAYMIEINSAPSLPMLSDGSTSYRQECMAKCFKYIHDTGSKERMNIESYSGWREVIHPGVWSRSDD